MLRYDPGHRAVLRNKGALLFNLDLYDPAAEVYRQLLGQGDTILTNLLNLGLICNMNRAYGESTALLERARQTSFIPGKIIWSCLRPTVKRAASAANDSTNF